MKAPPSVLLFPSLPPPSSQVPPSNSCNLTVVTLQESLEKKVSQALEQQARIKELENEVTKLNQELENLRIQKETSSTVQVNSGSSMVVSSLLVLKVSLFLLF